jgi:hypothetical protein
MAAHFRAVREIVAAEAREQSKLELGVTALSCGQLREIVAAEAREQSELELGVTALSCGQLR